MPPLFQLRNALPHSTDKSLKPFYSVPCSDDFGFWYRCCAARPSLLEPTPSSDSRQRQVHCERENKCPAN